MIEHSGYEAETLWPALYFQPLPFTEPTRDRPIEKLPVEVEVIGDVEVDESVVIDIAENGGRAPPLFLYPRGARGERTIPVVAIEDIGSIVSQIEIGIPVVVDVGHCDTLAETPIAHSGLLGHIGERPSSVVSEETIRLTGLHRPPSSRASMPLMR